MSSARGADGLASFVYRRGGARVQEILLRCAAVLFFMEQCHEMIDKNAFLR